jgi:hypothetical protein
MPFFLSGEAELARVSASLVVLCDLLRSGILVGLVEKSPFYLYKHWRLLRRHGKPELCHLEGWGEQGWGCSK